MHRVIPILLTIAACKAAAQSPYPTIVEFDLIFPRNETYGPAALMPVVFAFRNSPSWIPLIPILQWAIRKLPSGEDVDGGSIDLAWGINATTDPYILAFSSLGLNSTEPDGNYSMTWDLSFGNCTTVAAVPLGTPDERGLFRNETFNNTIFAIQKGGQSPNLAAESTCQLRQGFALNITATRTVEDPSFVWSNHNVCGVVANLLPTPSPCALNFDAAAASSVEASLTASYCRNTHANNTIICPPSPTSTNSGVRSGSASSVVTFWMLFTCSCVATSGVMIFVW